MRVRAEVLAGRARPAVRWIIYVLVAFLLVWPLLQILHELVVFAAAVVLQAVTTFPPVHALLLSMPVDPVYANATLEVAGKIKVVGVAVAGPAGALLHSVFPSIFATPELADGAWANAVILRGSTVMARMLSAFVADVALLALGLAVTRFALRRDSIRGLFRTPDRRLSLFFIAVLVQVLVVWRVAAAPPTLADLEIVGVSFAFGVLLPGFTGHRMAVSDLAGVVPAPLLVVVLVALALAVAYLAALLLLRVGRLTFKGLVWAGQHSAAGRDNEARLHRRLAQAFLALPAVMLLAVLVIAPARQPEVLSATAGGDLALAEQEVVAGTSPEAVNLVEETPIVAPALPSVVQVLGSNYYYVYFVNGQQQVIRGMGYNPMYAKLDRTERAKRYDRDFALMRRNGVNTVFGWINEEFDDLTLDKAQEYDLGVGMPYLLPPTLDYASPDVQASVTADVLSWVEKYKGHPSLRMWTVGNEVLHKLVISSWIQVKKSPESVARARAFSDFYVQLMDAVHQADPNHPVVLRDAEDGYLQWVRDALKVKPAARSWFVYGVNVYTNRLKDIVDNYRKHDMDVALFVSEFGPAGLGAKDRPEGYRRMWDVVRRNRQWTLGGVPYVWTTAGPEEVDRAFGLVDANGQPLDGALDAIGRMYVADQPAIPASKPKMPTP